MKIKNFETFKINESDGKYKKDDVVYNKRTNTIGIVRLGDDKYGEVKTDADGNVDVDELEYYNPMKYKNQEDATVAPSTKEEIDKRKLWKPFKINESSNYEMNYNGDSEDGYMKNWAKAFNDYILPLKRINGEGDEYEVDIEVVLENGKSFSYYCAWNSGGDENDGQNVDGVYEENIEYEGKEINLHNTEYSIYGIGYDMVSSKAGLKFKELLYDIGVLTQYSLLLNVEGYALHSETFKTREDAESAKEGWRIEIIEGKQEPTKTVGTLSESKLYEYTDSAKKKDTMRIENLAARAKDDAHLLRLVTTMANAITNPEKAYNRGLAAKKQNYSAAAKIFFDRAEKLGY